MPGPWLCMVLDFNIVELCTRMVCVCMHRCPPLVGPHNNGTPLLCAFPAMWQHTHLFYIYCIDSISIVSLTTASSGCVHLKAFANGPILFGELKEEIVSGITALLSQKSFLFWDSIEWLGQEGRNRLLGRRVEGNLF